MTGRLSPSALLAELGITDPEDLCIEAIAQHCGATILYEPLDGCAARILGFRDKAIITVDESASPERRRFSAGHELGHWMSDRGTSSFECEARTFATAWSSDNPERRANRFAADLLLPESLFVPLAKGREVTFEAVRDLAGRFTMSLTATAIRVVELGSFPAMVVCSEHGVRKWYYSGPTVPGLLRPHERLQPATMAWRIARGESSPGPTDVYAEDWVSPCDSGTYGVREDSIRLPFGLVLSLLWWKDEQQLIDLERADEREDGELY